VIDLYLDVETKGELTYGMLVPDWRRQLKKEPNCKIVLGVDPKNFFDEYYNCLKSLCEKVGKSDLKE